MRLTLMFEELTNSKKLRIPRTSLKTQAQRQHAPISPVYVGTSAWNMNYGQLFHIHNFTVRNLCGISVSVLSVSRMCHQMGFQKKTSSGNVLQKNHRAHFSMSFFVAHSPIFQCHSLALTTFVSAFHIHFCFSIPHKLRTYILIGSLQSCLLYFSPDRRIFTDVMLSISY